MGSRRTITSLLLVALMTLATACSDDPQEASDAALATAALHDDAITVGSFEFAESELLAEIYSQALETDGYEVERASGLGPRELGFPALAGGLVEVVPEYSGSALGFASLGGETAESDENVTLRALADTLEGRDIAVLAPAPAQDTNTFVVSRQLAEEEGLETLSDLAAIAPGLTFGGPPECETRPLCLPGLEEVYGIEFGEFVALDAGGPLTKQALADRGVDVALLFTTDPQLGDPALIELRDDRDLQPAENITPLVRVELVERWGDALVERIDSVSALLTTDVLRELNARVSSNDGDLAAVAAAWLDDEGLS
jgi:osmoprotectant transport system substrate-binding protein